MGRRSAPLLRRLPSAPPPSPLAGAVSRRTVTYMPRPGDGAPRTVTLIPGDGIGPLVTGAVLQVMEAMHAPVVFESYEVHGDMPSVPAEVIESIHRNKVCLKGGLATPLGGGVSSLNLQLRKELDLYASLVNCFNLPGLPTRHETLTSPSSGRTPMASTRGSSTKSCPASWRVSRSKQKSDFCGTTLCAYNTSRLPQICMAIWCLMLLQVLLEALVSCLEVMLVSTMLFSSRVLLQEMLEMTRLFSRKKLTLLLCFSRPR